MITSITCLVIGIADYSNFIIYMKYPHDSIILGLKRCYIALPSPVHGGKISDDSILLMSRTQQDDHSVDSNIDIPRANIYPA